MASLLTGLRQFAGNTLSGVGGALHLPELGLSEKVSGELVNNPIQNVYPNLSSADAMAQLLAPQTAQTDPNTAPAPTGYTTGAYGAGGSAPAYDANTDPNLVGQARGQAQSFVDMLHGLYAELNGMTDQYAQDRRGQIDTAYGNEYTNNDKAYAGAVDQTNANYTSRGAYDSSFRSNANQQNTDAYNASNTGLHNSQNDAYSQLGQIVAQNKANFTDPQYDLSQYNDVNSLTSLRDQLNSHIQNLQGQKSSLMTGGQLRDQLNAVAPAKSNLSGVLQSKLDALRNSNTPPEALYGLAQGYIGRSGLSQDEQQKYLQQFLAPQAA